MPPRKGRRSTQLDVTGCDHLRSPHPDDVAQPVLGEWLRKIVEDHEDEPGGFGLLEHKVTFQSEVIAAPDTDTIGWLRRIFMVVFTPTKYGDLHLIPHTLGAEEVRRPVIEETSSIIRFVNRDFEPNLQERINGSRRDFVLLPSATFPYFIALRFPPVAVGINHPRHDGHPLRLLGK
jgi:hypothetical protein